MEGQVGSSQEVLLLVGGGIKDCVRVCVCMCHVLEGVPERDVLVLVCRGVEVVGEARRLWERVCGGCERLWCACL